MIEEEQEILDEKTKEDLLEIIENKDWEYSVSEIIVHMKEKGYKDIGKIVKNALTQNIFFVNTIGDEGYVLLGLGPDGKDLWCKYNKEGEVHIICEEDETKNIQWKCSICNYQLEGTATPPEKCPGCGQTCSFIDATCYIPECDAPEGRDRRI